MTTVSRSKNHVLGRGQIFFARHDANKNPGQFRWLAASREFNLTVDTEFLEHTSSDRGINEVDARVPLSVTRSGTLTLEDISAANMALFFFGTKSEATRSLGASTTWTLPDSQLSLILSEKYMEDAFIPIGLTAESPEGAKTVSNVTVAGMNSANSPASVTLTKGTDWELLDDGGRAGFRLLDTNKTFKATGDAILSKLTVTYRPAAIPAGNDRFVSGGSAIEGALIFEETNPKGKVGVWNFPDVSLSPNGDMSLKAQEWRQIPLSLSVNKPANSEAIYYNDMPALE